MEFQKELNKELDKYRSVRELISQYLSYFMRRVSEEIEFIGLKKFDECEKNFDRIFEIQNILATTKYKYDYPLQSDIIEFIYQFERDDEFSRRYWYEKIQSGQELGLNFGNC